MLNGHRQAKLTKNQVFNYTYFWLGDKIPPNDATDEVGRRILPKSTCDKFIGQWCKQTSTLENERNDSKSMVASIFEFNPQTTTQLPRKSKWVRNLQQRGSYVLVKWKLPANSYVGEKPRNYDLHEESAMHNCNFLPTNVPNMPWILQVRQNRKDTICSLPRREVALTGVLTEKSSISFILSLYHGNLVRLKYEGGCFSQSVKLGRRKARGYNRATNGWFTLLDVAQSCAHQRFNVKKCGFRKKYHTNLLCECW